MAGMMGKGDPNMMDKGGMMGGKGDMMGGEGDASQGADQGGKGGGQEEIINAIQTLQTFILGQREQGNPNAGAMADAFKSLLQSMQQGGNESPEEQSTDNGPEVVNEQQEPGHGNKAMPMNAKKGAVPIM